VSRLVAVRLSRALAVSFTAALSWLIAPSAALACSVCIGAGNPDATVAYRAMTAFMTFTPMAIVGGVILWIWRRYKTLDEQDAVHGAAAPVVLGAPTDPRR